MRPLGWISILLFFVASAGSAAADPPGSLLPGQELGPEVAGKGRTSFVWVDPIEDLAADAVEDNHIAPILFINRCVGGCTITPGTNDSRTNMSSIVGGQTRVVQEFAYDDETYNSVVDCVKDVYSPYGVEIVTEDPGEMLHHEAILAGRPEDIGQPSMVLGIAPANCQPLNNVISFSFANRTQGNVEEMCWTLAQESAHAFGLPNHVLDCRDPMTYLPGCGRKYFRNKAFECGEEAGMPRPCNCSGTVQNSHVELSAVFGFTNPPPGPDVTILAPSADDTVLDEFGIFADAGGPRGVDRVELRFGGALVAEQEGGDRDRFTFTAPDWPDGYINVEIRAFNDLGSYGSSSARVLKGEPCQDAGTCFDGQDCVEGACEYPPAAKELGDSCDNDFQCIEGRCASNGGDRRVCAVPCNPSVEGACSDGFECLQEQSVCWPESTAGGCCSVAGSRDRDPLPWLLLGGVVLAALSWRKPRSAR